MALTIVKANAQTKWLILWQFDLKALVWRQITKYPVPFEVEDTRFQKAVVLAAAEGLVFFQKGTKPGSSLTNPVHVNRKIIDAILANPPTFKEPAKVDFDSYWRAKQQAEMNERLKVPNAIKEKYQAAYDRGDPLPDRILKLFPKRS